MADPFSIAAGVVGVASLSVQLLGGCIKGFILLSTARNLKKDAATIICMLDLQELQLTDWALRAGLLTGEGLLDHRINARAVEDTLRQLHNLLTNVEQLKKKYGLIIQPAQSDEMTQQEAVFAVSVNTGTSKRLRDQILSRSGVAQYHNALQRLWWASIDKEKIEKLVADIHFFIRELWHLLDPWRQDDVIESTQKIAASMIALNERFDQLTFLNDVLSSFKHEFGHEPRKFIDNLAISAKLKAYRVGLEQASGFSAMEPRHSGPAHPRLLAGLHHLSTLKLSDYHPLDKSTSMGTAMYDGEVVFVEEKLLAFSMQQKVLARAQALAALLSISSDRDFGTLQCRGIIESHDKVRFIFHHPYPGATAREPRSLLQLFHHRDGVKPPSLTKRISLALRIAQLLRNFHRAGWLHKSLRSENIIFFSQAENLPVGDLLKEPVIAGFAFSRQDSPTEISEQPSSDPKLDIYRHPAALGEPATSFTAEMDVYSLGTILLEIAEWRPLRHLVESVVDVSADAVPLSQLARIRSFLISGKGKGGTSKLEERAGDIYALACQMCFGGKIVETSSEVEDIMMDTKPSLLDAVVEKLNRCRI